MPIIMDTRDGQSRWGHSEYSRIKSAFLSGATKHICIRIPRTVFRQCGMSFNEIRSSDPKARYWEMAFQLFLEICRKVEEAGRAQELRDMVCKYPFQKVYLEWIPSKNDEHCDHRF